MRIHRLSSWCRATVAFVASLLTIASSASGQVRFRLPLGADTSIHWFCDHSPSAGVLDWDCGTDTYNGHRGTDFPAPAGTPVFAAADGILWLKLDGITASCPGVDQDPPCAGCSFIAGNYVVLNHGVDINGDTILTEYFHLQNSSVITKAIGSFIACGEQIGRVGQTGCATGNHLHFETRRNSASGWFDPYEGRCGDESSWWVDQGAGSPSTDCQPPKFDLGDTVVVFGVTSQSPLIVRGPNPCSAQIGSKQNGATGVVVDGPEICDSGTGHYVRWKINWVGGVVGWSAGNWLQQSDVSEARFTGVVTYAATGTPVSFATVTWGPYATTTGLEGVYAFTDVDCGTHPLQACDGYGNCSAPFSYTPPCEGGQLPPAAECAGGGCPPDGVAGGGIFDKGDTVQVVNTGTYGLKAWASICTGTWIVKPNGSVGTIVDGPNWCDGYYRWKVQWSGGGAARWSAQGDCDSGEFWLQEVVAGEPPDITTTNPLPTGTVGVAYSKTIQATDGSPPYLWSVVQGSLPLGLSLGTSTGLISGVPSSYGDFNPRLRVTDTAGLWDEKTFSLDVNPAPGAMTLTPTSDVIITGPPGGPFQPPSFAYTITNTGQSSLSYEWSHLTNWLSPSSGSGTMAAGVSSVKTFTLAASAFALPVGNYDNTIYFTDETNDITYTRQVFLTVGSRPPPCTAGDKLSPNSPTIEAGDDFGGDIAISGGYAIVGAYGHGGPSVPTGQGIAYIFKHVGSTWEQDASLLPVDGHAFGATVDITSSEDGDRAAVADYIDGAAPAFASGAVHLFKRSGSTWVPEAVLVASDASYQDQFGIDVSIEGDLCVIGAFGDDDVHDGSQSQYVGSAYIFRRKGTSWLQEEKLTASDAVAGARFGIGVDLLNAGELELAIIGADGGNANAAYIFRRSDGEWVEEAILLPPPPPFGDGLEFGRSVALAADSAGQVLAIVGAGSYACGPDQQGLACGAAYVFRREATTWSLEAILTPSDANGSDFFGERVSLATVAGQWRALIGAWGNDDYGNTAGSAYVFRRAVDGWTEESKILALEPAPGDRFGECVALDTTSGSFRALVAAPSNDDFGANSGIVFAYELAESPLAITQHPAGQAVTSGATATMTVHVVGNAPFSFAWQRDGDAVTDGGAVSGAMTDTLVIDPVTPSESGIYTVRISNVCGSITSEGATLVVGMTGDLNSDGRVDGSDLAIVLGSWGPCTDCIADLHADGVIDGVDLAVVLGHWTG